MIVSVIVSIDCACAHDCLSLCARLSASDVCVRTRECLCAHDCVVCVIALVSMLVFVCACTRDILRL